jgi:hypothetical protein
MVSRLTRHSSWGKLSSHIFSLLCRWAWELVGLVAALLGPTILAAQSVLLVSASATFQAPFALGVGGSVRWVFRSVSQVFR